MASTPEDYVSHVSGGSLASANVKPLEDDAISANASDQATDCGDDSAEVSAEIQFRAWMTLLGMQLLEGTKNDWNRTNVTSHRLKEFTSLVHHLLGKMSETEKLEQPHLAGSQSAQDFHYGVKVDRDDYPSLCTHQAPLWMPTKALLQKAVLNCFKQYKVQEASGQSGKGTGAARWVSYVDVMDVEMVRFMHQLDSLAKTVNHFFHLFVNELPSFVKCDSFDQRSQEQPPPSPTLEDAKWLHYLCNTEKCVVRPMRCKFLQEKGEDLKTSSAQAKEQATAKAKSAAKKSFKEGLECCLSRERCGNANR